MLTRLPELIEWLEARRERTRKRLGRFAVLLPVLSMAWGVLGGVSITRDYAHSTALLAYLAGLVVVSVGFRLWLDRRALQGERAEPEELDTASRRTLARILAERPYLVEGAALQVTQYCVQYIAMFCIPLLFLARAWVTLGCAVGVAATTIWDPWWRRLALHRSFAALLRCFCAVMATSFAFAVLWPKRLEWFHPAVGAVALAAVVPWDALRALRRPTRGEIGVLVLVAGVVGAQAMMDKWIRVPLLSVWLRKPALGVGMVDRSLREPWSGKVSRAQLKEALARGNEVCCLTPVVSPSGVAAKVVHEWRVDGELADRIELPAIRGGDDAKAFRTYSCKKHLPTGEGVRGIECRAFLEGSLYLGRAAVEVEP